MSGDFTVTDITSELRNYEQLNKNRHDGIKTYGFRGETAVLTLLALARTSEERYFDSADNASRNIASKGPSFVCLTTAANAFSAATR